MYYNSIKDIYGYPVYYSKIENKYLVKINNRLYCVDNIIRRIIEKSIMDKKTGISEGVD